MYHYFSADHKAGNVRRVARMVPDVPGPDPINWTVYGTGFDYHRNGEVRVIIQRTWRDDGGAVSNDELVSIREVCGNGRRRHMLRRWDFAPSGMRLALMPRRSARTFRRRSSPDGASFVDGAARPASGPPKLADRALLTRPGGCRKVPARCVPPPRDPFAHALTRACITAGLWMRWKARKRGRVIAFSQVFRYHARCCPFGTPR